MSRLRRRPGVRAAAIVAVITACGAPGTGESPRVTRDSAPAASGDTVALAIQPPADAEIPDDELGVAIRRGRALVLDPRDSLPGHVGSAMRCTSCHLDGGRRPNAAPWTGVYARFPQYRSRSGDVLRIEDRVNNCFTRSMNGRPLAHHSREMRDIVAYLAFLSRGYPVGGQVAGQGLARLAPLAADPARGARVYVANCARCHGDGGAGSPALAGGQPGAPTAPPLWGSASYNVAASMAQLGTAAAFIRANMPYDRPGTLTDQEAFDVAAYVNSHPRPDFVGKEHDWPKGDAPPDAPYPTLGAGPGRAGTR